MLTKLLEQLCLISMNIILQSFHYCVGDKKLKRKRMRPMFGAFKASLEPKRGVNKLPVISHCHCVNDLVSVLLFPRNLELLQNLSVYDNSATDDFFSVDNNAISGTASVSLYQLLAVMFCLPRRE